MECCEYGTCSIATVVLGALDMLEKSVAVKKGLRAQVPRAI
jgi:hypothetical protein